MFGGPNDDMLQGSLGGDFLFGEGGVDTLHGGCGSNFFDDSEEDLFFNCALESSIIGMDPNDPPLDAACAPIIYNSVCLPEQIFMPSIIGEDLCTNDCCTDPPIMG